MMPTEWMAESLEDLASHKRRAIATINQHLPSLQFKDKVIELILSEDTDAIPKVRNAGCLVEEVPHPYQVMHNGVKVEKYGFNGEFMAAAMYGLKGHHEPQEEKVFYEVLKTIPHGGTMLEIGAWWAYYSLWFAEAVPGARNILIEPNRQNLEVGQRNFQMNNREATFIQGYVGDTSTAYESAHGLPVDVQGARMVSIDSLVAELGIDHIHIVHSDIQGMEYFLLLSALQTIQKGLIDYFFISTHGEPIRQACLQFLGNQGYEIIATHSIEESLSFDGLIAAKRKGVQGPDFVPIAKRSSLNISQRTGL